MIQNAVQNFGNAALPLLPHEQQRLAQAFGSPNLTTGRPKTTRSLADRRESICTRDCQHGQEDKRPDPWVWIHELVFAPRGIYPVEEDYEASSRTQCCDVVAQSSPKFWRQAHRQARCPFAVIRLNHAPSPIRIRLWPPSHYFLKDLNELPTPLGRAAGSARHASRGRWGVLEPMASGSGAQLPASPSGAHSSITICGLKVRSR